jgi:hypothetical protein
MTTRKCNRCGKTKPEESFTRFSAWCRPCHNAYAAEKRRERKGEFDPVTYESLTLEKRIEIEDALEDWEKLHARGKSRSRFNSDVAACFAVPVTVVERIASYGVEHRVLSIREAILERQNQKLPLLCT